MRLLTLAALGLALAGQDVDPYDQSKVPLEVEPSDPTLAKVVLVAGRMSHGPGDHEYFAGLALLMKMLRQNPGVAPVMVRDGWPKNERIFENARSIVVFADGGGGHPLVQGERMDLLQKEIDKGAGFVALHYGVNFPAKASDRILSWLGGHILGGYSTSLATKWTAEFKSLPDHPVTRGLKPFTLNDEWYYFCKFVPDLKGVTPILKTVPPENTRQTPPSKEHPGREEVTAWAFERSGGGRGFGFTGGHMHKNWGDDSVRRLVTNAILWSAKVEVPAAGAKVELGPADLNVNLDDKRKKK
jgi:type 1 glutamine amidotransferase